MFQECYISDTSLQLQPTYSRFRNLVIAAMVVFWDSKIEKEALEYPLFH